MENANSSSKPVKETKLDLVLKQKQKLFEDQNRKYLETLFKENGTKPIRISLVQVNNAQEFRDSFVAAQLEPINKRWYTLGTFFRAIEETTENFTRQNLVENLFVQLNTIPSKRDTLVLQPIFNLVPVKKFYAKTGSNIGNGEGDGYIQLQLKNLFGGGESLAFDATSGTRTSSSYLLNYSMPLFNNTKIIWDNSAFINTRKLEWLGCESRVRGMTHKIYSKLGPWNFNIQLDNIWRVLNNVNSKSLEIMSSSGNNFKSSISTSINYDSRDNRHLPFTGSLWQVGLEVNGLTKYLDKFIKALVETQFAIPINQYNHLIVTNKAGVLYGLNKTFILDRFFMGGPNDVRSFTLNGLGPKLYGNSLGGDLFLNGGISLISKIPYTPTESNFKWHNFINYGNLQLYDRSKPFQGINQFSVSCGFGILYNHPMARFELNFVLPLLAHQRDTTRKGLQYGIGVSFL